MTAWPHRPPFHRGGLPATPVCACSATNAFPDRHARSAPAMAGVQDTQSGGCPGGFLRAEKHMADLSRIVRTGADRPADVSILVTVCPNLATVVTSRCQPRTGKATSGVAAAVFGAYYPTRADLIPACGRYTSAAKGRKRTRLGARRRVFFASPAGCTS